MLIKSTTGVNFINIFCTLFSYESLFWQLFLATFCLWQKKSYEKHARKTLMKSTTGWIAKEVGLNTVGLTVTESL